MTSGVRRVLVSPLHAVPVTGLLQAGAQPCALQPLASVRVFVLDDPRHRQLGQPSAEIFQLDAVDHVIIHLKLH